MFKRLSAFLDRLATGRNVLIFLGLDVLFNALILPAAQKRIEAASGGLGPIDLVFFYAPQKALEMVAAYGEAGRAFYRLVELTADILYPLTYAFAFGLLITWLFKRAFAGTSFLQRLNVLPFVAMAFDFLENAGIVTLLSLYPAQPAAVALITSLFSAVKWALAFASIALILVGLAGWLARKISGK
jgi:hypothetical protein